MGRVEKFGIVRPDLSNVVWNKRTKARHTAQFAKDYLYSGKMEVVKQWDEAPDLRVIMEILNKELSLNLNCCLVNRYLDKKVSGIGRHKDGEKEHADDLIVSVSFGASTEFELDGQLIELVDGDICCFNRNSWHSIPYKLRDERISITYRQFV